ncbi:MAG: Asp-tRNA(Asn)/Glu-tRNA(Gln) amidotransferase subunit GatC [Candidatus Omnitrophota bacterium]|nr:MAG: Asp-tRNA(Asn)/Glu-tRNA(Gln) amidotransferase subunit GatC [Candidatus Omnitrophota bacterium]
MAKDKLIEYVAELARIKITPHQAEFLQKQLEHILEYINKLKEVNVDGVEPMRGLHQERDVLRQDEAVSFEFKEDILNNAPSKQDNYFKIPKVIE